MAAYYHVYDDFSRPEFIKGDLNRFVVDHLYESINNNQNRVLIVSLPID